MFIMVEKDITIGKIICCQMIVCLVACIALLCFKGLFWCFSGFAAGMAICLPNSLFMLLTNGLLSNSCQTSAISWLVIVGWTAKLLLTIAILILAIGVFKVAMLPFCMVILLMWIVHISTPVLMRKT